MADDCEEAHSEKTFANLNRNPTDYANLKNLFDISPELPAPQPDGGTIRPVLILVRCTCTRSAHRPLDDIPWPHKRLHDASFRSVRVAETSQWNAEHRTSVLFG